MTLLNLFSLFVFQSSRFIFIISFTHTATYLNLGKFWSYVIEIDVWCSLSKSMVFTWVEEDGRFYYIYFTTALLCSGCFCLHFRLSFRPRHIIVKIECVCYKKCCCCRIWVSVNVMMSGVTMLIVDVNTDEPNLPTPWTDCCPGPPLI